MKKITLKIFVTITLTLTLSACEKEVIIKSQDKILKMAENIRYEKIKNIYSEIKPYTNCNEGEITCTMPYVMQSFRTYESTDKICSGFNNLDIYYNLRERKIIYSGEKLQERDIYQKSVVDAPNFGEINYNCKSYPYPYIYLTGYLHNDKNVNIFTIISVENKDYNKLIQVRFIDERKIK